MSFPKPSIDVYLKNCNNVSNETKITITKIISNKYLKKTSFLKNKK